MFNSNGAISIGTNVAPLAVLTFKGLLFMLTLSESFKIFVKICMNM